MDALATCVLLIGHAQGPTQPAPSLTAHVPVPLPGRTQVFQDFDAFAA